VLEIRNHDVPFLLEDGNPLFRLVFFKNSEPPDRLYGQALGSSYQGQRLKLGKQFAQP
jgi:dCTP deaminase